MYPALPDFLVDWLLRNNVKPVFDILLSISDSYNDKIIRKIRPEIREKFHFEILANFGHSKIFNSAIPFKTSYHSIKLVEPIKSYSDFSKSIFSWECEKRAKLFHFTKEFLGNRYRTKNSRFPINTTVRLRSVWRQRKTDNVSAVWQVYGSLTLAYFLPQAAIRQLTENCPKTANVVSCRKIVRNRVLLSVFGQNLKYVIKATFGYEINEMSI